MRWYEERLIPCWYCGLVAAVVAVVAVGGGGAADNDRDSDGAEDAGTC